MADDPTPPTTRTVLEWASAKGTPEWLLRATAAKYRWELAAEVIPTSCAEADYDAAVLDVAHGRV